MHGWSYLAAYSNLLQKPSIFSTRTSQPYLIHCVLISREHGGAQSAEVDVKG